MSIRRYAKWLIRLLPIAYMILIWYLSSHPSDSIIYFKPALPTLAPGNPVIVIPSVVNSPDAEIKERLHFVEFAILYGLWVIALLTRQEFTIKDNTLAAVVSLAYGAVDELHQIFVPSRSATVVDFLKDLTGVALVYLVVHLCYFIYKDSIPGRMLRRYSDIWRTP